MQLSEVVPLNAEAGQNVALYCTASLTARMSALTVFAILAHSASFFASSLNCNIFISGA